jgi:AcrR family transcriptional regulator
MADIGTTAGITGPAIYRHFGAKSAVLVSLFDRVIDRLLDEANAIARQESAIDSVLMRLVKGQVDFVVTDRVLAHTQRRTPRRSVARCADGRGRPGVGWGWRRSRSMAR